MAKPSTRQGLIDYCLRQLGAPVLEINVDDDQIDDLVDDAIQYFNERHYDGVEKMYLKYKITEDDVNRGRAKNTGRPSTFTFTTASQTGSYLVTGTDRAGTVHLNAVDPTIDIEVGDTIIFDNTNTYSAHPMYIKAAAGSGVGAIVSSPAAIGQGSARVSWTPTTPGTYYYQCSNHTAMLGTITVSAHVHTGVGVVTTTATDTSGREYKFYETENYIQVPDSVIGVEKIFKFDTSSISGGMFSIKYQLFLNDLYYFNSVELLQYSMTKSYLEDIDHLLTTDKQIRFNKRQDRLYLDIDWGSQSKDEFIVIECYRALDPASFTQIYNDSFMKLYLTALIKRQWGRNLSKFRGVKLPGGIELNGGEILQQAESEIADIRSRMMSEFELPPLDFIG